MGWRRLLRCEKGGIDFVQVATALLIVAIAAVSTTYSIYIGRATLTEQLQEKQAIRYAREEMEYWCGRVFAEFPTGQELLGDTQGGRRVLIDARDPGDRSDNVWGRVYYEPIRAVFLPLTGEDTSDYYELHVWVEWPDDRSVKRLDRHRVDIYSSMINKEGGGVGGSGS
jgi:hypothetical protein